MTLLPELTGLGQLTKFWYTNPWSYLSSLFAGKTFVSIIDCVRYNTSVPATLTTPPTFSRHHYYYYHRRRHRCCAVATEVRAPQKKALRYLSLSTYCLARRAKSRLGIVYSPRVTTAVLARSSSISSTNKQEKQTNINIWYLDIITTSMAPIMSSSSSSSFIAAAVLSAMSLLAIVPAGKGHVYMMNPVSRNLWGTTAFQEKWVHHFYPSCVQYTHR